MKQHILSISSTLLAAASICSSCVDLKSEMYDVINPDIFPKNEQDALSLVTSAAYSPFRSSTWSGLYTSSYGGIHVMTEMTTDVGDCQWNADVWPDMIQMNFTPNSTGIVGVYKNYINDLSTMTLTMQRIESIPMSESLRKRLMAELQCARGWLGYILYDLYGPIQVADPAILDKPLKDQVAPRLSQPEMVKFIEDNLKAAIEVLPPTYGSKDSNYGRFTKGLAYTVLMKLYMHEKEWEKAVACGRELMKAEYGYALLDNYKDIFTLSNEGNAETIWACVCNRSVNRQLWLAHVLSGQYPTSNPKIQKWGGYRVTWDFYQTFDPQDKRLETLIGSFTAANGVTYDKNNPGTVFVKGAMPIKYGEDPEATGEESQIDWIVFRYADVLTLLAEAIVRHQNNVTPEAIDLLNRVHVRAGLSSYTLADFDGAESFLEAVLLERGHELWFEGARRTDLIRFGKYIEYARRYKKSTTAQEYMNLMPLPQTIIDESKGQLIQNEGYR